MFFFQSCNKFSKSSTWFLLLLLLPVACVKTNDQQFPLGSELIQNNFKISIVDTFSVEMATVQFDSILTSGADTMLIGQYTDDRLGYVKAQSYFRLQSPSTYTTSSNDVFDSLTLKLRLNGYYYGDTNITQKFIVYRLAESLTLSAGTYHYNIDTIHSYYENPLGFINFRPHPKEKLDIEIPLNPELGALLFQQILDKKANLTINDTFINYFKGIRIISTGSKNASVLGISDTSVMMRIYGHENGLEKKDFVFDFKLETGDTHFSQITYDRTGTSLKDLKIQEKSIPSALASEEVYLQGGTGLSASARFPTLGKILEIEKVTILKAELILKPVEATYINSQLSGIINYYAINKKNQILGSSTGTNSQTAGAGTLILTDPIYNENTNYSMDITSYILDQLGGKYYDPGKSGLLFIYKTPSYTSGVTRIVLGGGKHPTKKALLKLYLLRYE
jgi:hypothetical protein